MSSFQFELGDLPPQALAIRHQVRAFVREELAAGHWWQHGDFISHFSPEFSARLGARGWLGITWPKEYGGGGEPTIHRYVITEELLAAGAPVAAHWVADRQSGPLLLRFGTELQRRKYLPGIAAGKLYFAIGMSEPDSGSDLASVRTRGVKVEGGWRITGRKVWTSWAHRCHYAITLVRTEQLVPEGSRHRGLSQFVVDLKGPGITIRPILNMAGKHEFNEVVFDDAFVSDDTLVGAPGNGWAQVTSELAYERSGPERFLASIRLLIQAVNAAGMSPSPRVAEQLGRLTSQLMTLRRMSISVAGMLSRGAMPNLEAALIKDLGNSFERTVPEIARLLREELPGADGLFDTLLEESLLNAPSWSLRGGTREILKGIIGRGLGLR